MNFKGMFKKDRSLFSGIEMSERRAREDEWEEIEIEEPYRTRKIKPSWETYMVSYEGRMREIDDRHLEVVKFRVKRDGFEAVRSLMYNKPPGFLLMGFDNMGKSNMENSEEMVFKSVTKKVRVRKAKVIPGISTPFVEKKSIQVPVEKKVDAVDEGKPLVQQVQKEKLQLGRVDEVLPEGKEHVKTLAKEKADAPILNEVTVQVHDSVADADKKVEKEKKHFVGDTLGKLSTVVNEHVSGETFDSKVEELAVLKARVLAKWCELTGRSGGRTKALITRAQALLGNGRELEGVLDPNRKVRYAVEEGKKLLEGVVNERRFKLLGNFPLDLKGSMDAARNLDFGEKPSLKVLSSLWVTRGDPIPKKVDKGVWGVLQGVGTSYSGKGRLGYSSVDQRLDYLATLVVIYWMTYLFSRRFERKGKRKTLSPPGGQYVIPGAWRYRTTGFGVVGDDPDGGWDGFDRVVNY